MKRHKVPLPSYTLYLATFPPRRRDDDTHARRRQNGLVPDLKRAAMAQIPVESLTSGKLSTLLC